MFTSLYLAFLFLVLGVIHFYWAAGGIRWFEDALPMDEKGNPLFVPGAVASSVVGLGLTFFSLLYVMKSGMLDVVLPSWLTKGGGWLVAGIFILRGIGDFKYVGLFKKVKTTKFAIKDTKFYTPLCFLIGLAATYLELRFWF